MDASVITNITAPPIPTAVEILLDTPKNGQSPKNWARTMLLTRIAEIMMIIYSMVLLIYLFHPVNDGNDISQGNKSTGCKYKYKHPIGLDKLHSEKRITSQ
jgi:hypothetical protein